MTDFEPSWGVIIGLVCLVPVLVDLLVLGVVLVIVKVLMRGKTR